MERPRVDYDQLADVYDARYKTERLAGISTALIELIRRSCARRILEAGCGTGHWLDALRSHSGFICGADSSTGMLDQARRKIATAPLVAARANALPFTAGSFDLIFCVNAVHHFDDPAAFIGDASRLLADGGVLAVIGMDPRLSRRRYLYEYFRGTYDRDLRRYPAVGDIVNWMAAAGFARIEYSIPERYQRVFRGREVLSDPFLSKKSNSLLALLGHAEYEQGVRSIRAAIDRGESHGAEAEFLSDVALPMIAAWRE